jgi:hypothetical protein
VNFEISWLWWSRKKLSWRLSKNQCTWNRCYQLDHGKQEWSDFLIWTAVTLILNVQARSTSKQANKTRFTEKRLEKSVCQGYRSRQWGGSQTVLPDHQYLLSPTYGRE